MRRRNKKVINATREIFNNISFRSRLERNCYKMLLESGLPFSYESEKIILKEGFSPSNLILYAPIKYKGKLSKTLEYQPGRLRAITYTPDFKVVYNNFIFYIESKGNPNDVYPYKKKLLLDLLMKRNDGYKYIFIEPHNLSQMEEAINFIKNIMNTPTERIHNLIPNLNEKDRILGFGFLEKRDFESLKSLVSSAIYKLKKTLKKEGLSKEIIETEICGLIKLEAEIDIYMTLSDI